MVFRGIPYARPPLEDLRWKKPEPFTLNHCWSGVLKAHDAKDTCWQVYSNSSINGNENCLTLDIITPQVRYINPLPVSISFQLNFSFAKRRQLLSKLQGVYSSHQTLRNMSASMLLSSCVHDGSEFLCLRTNHFLL